MARESTGGRRRHHRDPAHPRRRYRKRPVEVYAIRNEGEWVPILEWLDAVTGTKYPGTRNPDGSLRLGGRPPITRNDDGSLNIQTPEGTMRAEVGDWVIQGVQGEFYPCKPAIFQATYEPLPPRPSGS